MLTPYRVLDLTDNRAALGPMILADLGADVIKIEPHGGSSERADIAHFAAYNRNKRSVSLDLDGTEGRESFLQLAAGAGFLFENAHPGAMAARGLGFDDLIAVNPRLVYVSISPFGQDGPYAAHLATDLTLAAMSGMVALTGDADRPPLRISVPQTWLHASAESAVAALVAHQRRLQTGEGQYVDVSVQAAAFWTLLNAMTAHATQGYDFERNGTAVALSTISLKVLFECSDGYTIIAPNLVLAVVLPWMIAEGLAPESWLTEEDWPRYFERVLTGQPVSHSVDEVTDRVEAFTRRHTKRELFERGLPYGAFFAPVSTIPDLLALEHLKSGRYWRSMSLPGGEVARVPGPFVRFSQTPMAEPLQFPVPGEANEAILTATARAPAAGTAPAGRHPFSGLPFASLKVADFSWVVVGPLTAKYLADHGATTVRVESSVRPDILRRSGPYKDGIIGANRSQYFGAFNTSKLSLSIDLKQPAGREVARRLVAWADVLLESFTQGTMRDLGLDYETVQQINPGIIMVSTCLMGQGGPPGLAGYGFHAAAISGFPELTGWPDRPPSGPWAAYTDTIANRFLAASIMAALDHRRRTGEGQYIDQAQMESALHFLAPEVIEYQISGVVPARCGNDSHHAAPHNVYPCLGADEWCAIAVESDEQWRALLHAMGEPGWAAVPLLATLAGRLERRRQIDEQIAAWTEGLERYELMRRLQAAGVPAGAVQRSSDLLIDPQLEHLHFFRRLLHPEMGEVPYEGHQFCIRGYDSGPRSPAPCLGEHSVQVLRDILGMSDEEIAEAVSAGALV